LDIVKKIWVPLRKLIAPLGLPSWLRAWLLQRWPWLAYCDITTILVMFQMTFVEPLK